MTRQIVTILALFTLAACLGDQPTWYEDRCLRLGFERGGTEFNNCIQRDRKWITENQRRPQGEGGR